MDTRSSGCRPGELLKVMVSSDVGSHEKGMAKKHGIATAPGRSAGGDANRIFWSCQIVSVTERVSPEGRIRYVRWRTQLSVTRNGVRSGKDSLRITIPRNGPPITPGSVR